MGAQWTKEQAWDWNRQQPWIVGSNFIPSSAINQLEMWQADTYDPGIIDRELGWAQSLGFNTIRVYLHDLLWEQDAPGFKARIDGFLDICAGKNIKPILVFFDDCWNAEFSPGRQPEPRPGMHNSGWVQSPGSRKVVDPSTWARLQAYVQDVLNTFKDDARIRLWDLYNEPGNNNLREKSLGLLKAVFGWAWEVRPSQPLSVGVWFDHPELNAFQLESSDVTTFHNYMPLDSLIEQINQLKLYGRPMICTEYMARVKGSRFETHMPVFKREGVGCINWGLVNGKTQTHLAWASEPKVDEWFHDIFRSDGSPYNEMEVSIIRSITESPAG